MNWSGKLCLPFLEYIPAWQRTTADHFRITATCWRCIWDVTCNLQCLLIQGFWIPKLFFHICFNIQRCPSRNRYEHNYNDEKLYQSFLEGVYLQVDAYIGEFLPLLDKGWAIIVTSDHGLLCAEEDEFPFLGDGFSMNVGVLRELGYTTLKTDAEGNLLHEINWTKTKAVAPRGNHIYVNLFLCLFESPHLPRRKSGIPMYRNILLLSTGNRHANG